MKRYFSPILGLACAAVWLLGCALPPSSASIEKAPDPVEVATGQILLGEGEGRHLPAFGLTVTFDKLVSDSRCPTGVSCIWEGAATVKVSLRGKTGALAQVELSTLDVPGRALKKSANFESYTVTLTEVMPYPVAQQSPGKYKIGLQIQRKK